MYIGQVHLSFKECLVYFVIFLLFRIDIPVSKLCRPWSDVAFCGDTVCLGLLYGTLGTGMLIWQEDPGGDEELQPMYLKWAAAWQNQQNDLCTQRRLRSAWASAQSDQSSVSAWRKLGSLATYWAYSKDSDQTGQMPRLIWVFAGRTGQFVGFVMRRLISPITASIKFQRLQGWG